jgi:hypothetical protein
VDGGIETSVLSIGHLGLNKVLMGGNPQDGKMIAYLKLEKYKLHEHPSCCPRLHKLI